MGKKGEKRTADAASVAEEVVSSLAPMRDVRSRGMFGGYGIFQGEVMFGLVDSKGVFRLRANDETKAKYESRGGEKMGRMPYYSVPAAVQSSPKEVLAWAEEAAGVAKAAKSKKKKRTTKK